MSVYITATGLDGFSKFLDDFPIVAPRALRLALNQTAERVAVPQSRELIGEQVAFPRGYLNDDRLGLSRRATDSSLVAIVTGRHRATSLARFAIGQSVETSRKTGVRVTVKPGRAQQLRRAFLIRLRSGAAITADDFNLGLAIRLRAGETLPANTIGAKRLANGLWLLYGPSVDQVFREVAATVADKIGAPLENEFLRQFNRGLAANTLKFGVS